MLDRAIAEAGIDRKAAFVTNAVKHFKFEPRGNARLHKPQCYEIDRCRFWLDNELRLVRPKVVVALGASAARSLAPPDDDRQDARQTCRSKAATPRNGCHHPPVVVAHRDDSDEESNTAPSSPTCGAPRRLGGKTLIGVAGWVYPAFHP